MKILTVSSSPYLHVRNSVINREIILNLKKLGHEVCSAVWHHDEGYFMPDLDGVQSFEHMNENICQLHPFEPQSQDSSIVLYELFKSFQPELVISIGDYHESLIPYTVKAMFPNFFKWIAILTIDSPTIHESVKNELQYVDHVVCLSEMAKDAVSLVYNGPITKLNFVTEEYNFSLDKMNLEFSALNMSKNAQSSNIPAFIRSCSLSQSKGYLHTNIYDTGEYDIDNLLKRYDQGNMVKITDDFVSVKESVDRNRIQEIFNQNHVIVDCSGRAACALNVLDGMSAGMLPLAPSYGVFKEIISRMKDSHLFLAPYETFISEREEEFMVVSTIEMAKKLKEIHGIYVKNKNLFTEYCLQAKDIVKKYRKKDFIGSLLNIKEELSNQRDTIIVDSII